MKTGAAGRAASSLAADGACLPGGGQAHGVTRPTRFQGNPEPARNAPPILVGLGEILWDLLPTGRQLGGAPANFAYHAHALGAEARLVSRIGGDALGEAAREQLAALGLSLEALQVDPILATGTAGVSLTADGQPHFTIHEPAAWDALEFSPASRHAVADAHAVCFGTLAQRGGPSRATLRALLSATPPFALRILDLNLRQHYFSRAVIEDSLALAQILKLNDGELAQLASLLDLSGDARAQMARLAERYQLRCVACTRGAQGSLLFAAGAWSEHPGIPTEVVDTVGAGDAFAAAMTLGLLAGWPLEEINHRAVALATYVCTQRGATPPVPATLRAAFRVACDAAVEGKAADP